MGSNRSNAGDIAKQRAAAAAAGVQAKSYSAHTVKSGTDLATCMDPAYGGLRLSMLPQNAINKVLLPITLALDVSGSNAVVAKIILDDLPQFWELLAYLLPADKFHVNLQFAAVDDNQDRVPLQLGQFEGDGLLVEKWLTDLYPVGRGWGNGVEAYNSLFWALLNQNRLQVWEKGGKGFAFVMFDEGVEYEILPSQLRHIYNATSDLTETQVVGAEVSVNQRKATNLDLPDQNLLTSDVVAALKEKYHLYGVFCSESNSYGDAFAEATHAQWRELLGNENVFPLTDSKNISELVAAVVAAIAGTSKGVIEKAIASTVDATGMREIGNALSLVRRDFGIAPSNNTNIVRLP